MTGSDWGTAILAGTIAIAMPVIGAGVTYVVNFEKRISLLEERINTLQGYSIGTSVRAGNGETSESSGTNEDRAPDLERAIAEGCSQLISTYNRIIAGDSALYLAEQEKLSALEVQMGALGCTQNSKLGLSDF